MIRGNFMLVDLNSIGERVNFESIKLMANDLVMESNYGALEKDERILDITKLILDDIKSETILLTEEIPKQLFNTIYTKIEPKYKDEQYNPHSNVKLTWYIWTEETIKFTHIFCEKTGVTHESKDSHILQLFFNKDSYESDKKYIHKLKEFIQTKARWYIAHEVKHILDVYDGVFPVKKKSYTKPEENKSKYVSQNSEINAMVINTILEIQNIKDMDKLNVWTFDDVVQMADWYPKLIQYLPSNKRNFFKAKIADFWIKNYEQQRK